MYVRLSTTSYNCCCGFQESKISSNTNVNQLAQLGLHAYQAFPCCYRHLYTYLRTPPYQYTAVVSQLYRESNDCVIVVFRKPRLHTYWFLWTCVAAGRLLGMNRPLRRMNSKQIALQSVVHTTSGDGVHASLPLSLSLSLYLSLSLSLSPSPSLFLPPSLSLSPIILFTQM